MYKAVWKHSETEHKVTEVPLQPPKRTGRANTSLYFENLNSTTPW